MSAADFAIPILGFILVVISALSLKEEVSKKKVAELIVGLFIMGFSIWASVDNSETIKNFNMSNSDLKGKLNELIESRRIDSNNNVVFQEYLKDTFGIVRRGDKPVKIFVSNTKNYFSSIVENNKVNDKENYEIKQVGDILNISPKEGTWIHGYFAFDTSNSKEFNEMLEEGMGTPNIVDKISVNAKIFNTHLIRIYNRAVYKNEPIRINISTLKNGYIIFGEEGNKNKRYIYKQGKVIWIPN
jgi:hypothetical protein